MKTELHCGEMLETLGKMPDKSIDLICIDFSREYEERSNGDWKKWISSVLKEANRILKRNGSVAAANVLARGAFGETWREEMKRIWNERKMFLWLLEDNACIDCLWYTKSKDGFTYNGAGDPYSSALTKHEFWNYWPPLPDSSDCKDGGKMSIRFWKKVVDAFTKKGYLVFALPAGTGQCGAAALSLGRNFIGIEESQPLYEEAQKTVFTATPKETIMENTPVVNWKGKKSAEKKALCRKSFKLSLKEEIGKDASGNAWINGDAVEALNVLASKGEEFNLVVFNPHDVNSVKRFAMETMVDLANATATYVEASKPVMNKDAIFAACVEGKYAPYFGMLMLEFFPESDWWHVALVNRSCEGYNDEFGPEAIAADSMAYLAIPKHVDIDESDWMFENWIDILNGICPINGKVLFIGYDEAMGKEAPKANWVDYGKRTMTFVGYGGFREANAVAKSLKKDASRISPAFTGISVYEVAAEG